MRHRIDQPVAHQGQQRLHIDPRRLDKRVDQQPVPIEYGRAVEIPQLVFCEPANQRIAVGMHSRTRETEKDMSRRDTLARQLLPALDCADAETGKVVIAGGIHARHFRRFTTDQRATCLLAAFGNAGNHPLGHAILELAGGEIVQEEKRFGPLNDQIVDAHGNEIDSDRVMFAAIDGELQLGADAIVACHQQRILVARSLGIEKAPEPADFAIGTRAHGGLHQRPDGLDESIARLD